MKEHFQDYGVRKWAGDDLIELQSEPLVALQALVSPYAPCIISGCAVVQNGASYKIESGLVALRGVDVDGQACVKIVRVEAFDTPTLPVYLSLAYDRISRAYADGSSKTIANNYIAVSSVQASEGALELTAAGGKRLVDTIGVSQKLDRVGGEAKDVIVSFVEAATRSELENKSKLGVLIGQAKKWFSDLRTLAFKDKVAKSDLDAALTTELDNKVAKEDGKGLSTNDLTDALKDKLNNHSHAWSTITGKPSTFLPSSHDHAWDDIANKPSTFTPSEHGHAALTDIRNTNSIATTPNDYNGGFHVKGIKLYTICGLTKAQTGGNYVQVFGYRGFGDQSGGYAHEFALTDSGKIFHRYGLTTAWSSWVELGYASHTHSVATTASSGFMQVSDKIKLNKMNLCVVYYAFASNTGSVTTYVAPDGGGITIERKSAGNFRLTIAGYERAKYFPIVSAGGYHALKSWLSGDLFDIHVLDTSGSRKDAGIEVLVLGLI